MSDESDEAVQNRDGNADSNRDGNADSNRDGNADSNRDDNADSNRDGNADSNRDGNGTSGVEPNSISEPPLEPGWERRERAYRGISRRLAAHYLRNLGGSLVDADEPADATRVDGDGWRVTLRSERVNVAGSIVLTEVTVSFAGAPDALDDLISKFKRKAMRAGG